MYYSWFKEYRHTLTKSSCFLSTCTNPSFGWEGQSRSEGKSVKTVALILPSDMTGTLSLMCERPPLCVSVEHWKTSICRHSLPKSKINLWFLRPHWKNQKSVQKRGFSSIMNSPLEKSNQPMILQKSMLGGGFKHFLFSPRNPGKMIQFDVHIFFKWGWNQPPTRCSLKPLCKRSYCWWFRNPAVPLTSWGKGSWNPIIYSSGKEDGTVPVCKDPLLNYLLVFVPCILTWLALTLPEKSCCW